MIADFVTKLREDFATDGVTADVLLGKDFVAQEGGGNRVVVVPVGFTYGPSEFQALNPRPVYCRKQSLAIHIWGVGTPIVGQTQSDADLDAAELLADRFAVSFYRVAPYFGGGQPGSGTFSNVVLTEAFGAEMVFTSTLSLPVFETPWPTTAPTGNQAEIAPTGIDNMTFPSGDYPAC